MTNINMKKIVLLLSLVLLIGCGSDQSIEEEIPQIATEVLQENTDNQTQEDSDSQETRTLKFILKFKYEGIATRNRHIFDILFVRDAKDTTGVRYNLTREEAWEGGSITKEVELSGTKDLEIGIRNVEGGLQMSDMQIKVIDEQGEVLFDGYSRYGLITFPSYNDRYPIETYRRTTWLMFFWNFYTDTFRYRQIRHNRKETENYTLFEE